MRVKHGEVRVRSIPGRDARIDRTPQIDAGPPGVGLPRAKFEPAAGAGPDVRRVVIEGRNEVFDVRNSAKIDRSGHAAFEGGAYYFARCTIKDPHVPNVTNIRVNFREGDQVGGILRSNARRACLTLAAACALLASIAPFVGAAEEDDVPAPEVFTGSASALGVSVDIHPPDLLPVGDLFKFIALDGDSTFQSSKQAARASLLFPGNGAILGPSLACGQFGGMFPPEFKPILDLCLQYQYPLSVTADEFQPDASTNGSLDLGGARTDLKGTATLARAHAADDGSRTDAVINDLGLLGLPPFGAVQLPLPNQQLDSSVFTIDNATARTDHRIVKGALVSKGVTTLSGINLIGGLVSIGSIVSESIITDNADGKQTADANLKVTGVTVAGVPAQITAKGLVLGSPQNTTPLNLALADQVNRLLKNLDVKLTTLPVEETANKGGPAVASTGGVLLELSRSVSGLPQLPSPIGARQQLDINGKYTVSLQLAATGARGSAANFGADDETEVGGESDEFLGGDFSDDGDFGLGSDFGSGDDGFPSITNPRATGSGNPDSSLVANTVDRFGGRLGFVYLALMFSVLGLCIAPRLAVPARFGPKSS